MIKINLMQSFIKSAAATLGEADGGLDSAASTGGASSESSLVSDFIKKMLVLFLGALALTAYEFYNIPQLKTKLAGLQAQLNEAVAFNQKHDALKAEIVKYEADLKSINNKTFFLEQIQIEKNLAVDLITKMKNVIDPMVWLSSIQVAGRNVEIRGSAESIQRVNQFNSMLSNVAYLKDVITVSIENYRDSSNFNLTYQNFTIRASYADIQPTAPDMESISGGMNE